MNDIAESYKNSKCLLLDVTSNFRGAKFQSIYEWLQDFHCPTSRHLGNCRRPLGAWRRFHFRQLPIGLPRDILFNMAAAVINIHDFTLKSAWKIIEPSLNNKSWLQFEMWTSILNWLLWPMGGISDCFIVLMSDVERNSSAKKEGKLQDLDGSSRLKKS